MNELADKSDGNKVHIYVALDLVWLDFEGHNSTIYSDRANNHFAVRLLWADIQ